MENPRTRRNDGDQRPPSAKDGKRSSDDDIESPDDDESDDDIESPDDDESDDDIESPDDDESDDDIESADDDESDDDIESADDADREDSSSEKSTTPSDLAPEDGDSKSEATNCEKLRRFREEFQGVFNEFKRAVNQASRNRSSVLKPDNANKLLGCDPLVYQEIKSVVEAIEAVKSWFDSEARSTSSNAASLNLAGTLGVQMDRPPVTDEVRLKVSAVFDYARDEGLIDRSVQSQWEKIIKFGNELLDNHKQIKLRFKGLKDTEDTKNALREVRRLLMFKESRNDYRELLYEHLYIGPGYNSQFYRFLHKHNKKDYSALIGLAKMESEQPATEGKSPSPEMFFENCPCGGDL